MSNLSLSSSDWMSTLLHVFLFCLQVLLQLFTFLMVHMYTFCGLIIGARIKKYTKAFLSYMNIVIFASALVLICFALTLVYNIAIYNIAIFLYTFPGTTQRQKTGLR